jgi:glucose-1-phosphate thymidylyltransferase
MKLIIPMAGMGKRMRPHTLTVPKPLLPVAGKPMVQHLVEDICKMTGEKIEEIGFVIGNFGKEAEQNLVKVAENMGAKGKIFYQKEPLGTAHATLCAAELLKGKVIVAFADTLFRGEVKIDASKDGVIWVQKVQDPKPFGVVKLDAQNIITDFVEKPQTFVSDLAIIGIYYFNDGEYLHREMQYLIDNDIKEKGEYQLTNALENMKKKGSKFTVAQVEEWLDCGNKEAMLFTNQRMLATKADRKTTTKTENSKIIQPCYIDESVVLKNSTIGPNVSIGAKTTIENSVITDSIIQESTTILKSDIHSSMVGSYVSLEGIKGNLSIGDYNQVKN